MKKPARKNRVFKPTSESMLQSEISTRIITNSQQRYAETKTKTEYVVSRWGNNSRIPSYINNLMNMEEQGRATHYDTNYYPLPMWYQNVVGALALDLSVEYL